MVKEIHKLKKYEELSRHLRNKYNIVIQEKMDIDDILLRQEEKVIKNDNYFIDKRFKY